MLSDDELRRMSMLASGEILTSADWSEAEWMAWLDASRAAEQAAHLLTQDGAPAIVALLDRVRDAEALVAQHAAALLAAEARGMERAAQIADGAIPKALTAPLWRATWWG